MSDLFGDQEVNTEGTEDKEEDTDRDYHPFLRSTPATPETGGHYPVLRGPDYPDKF